MRHSRTPLGSYSKEFIPRKFNFIEVQNTPQSHSKCQYLIDAYEEFNKSKTHDSPSLSKTFTTKYENQQVKSNSNRTQWNIDQEIRNFETNVLKRGEKYFSNSKRGNEYYKLMRDYRSILQMPGH